MITIIFKYIIIMIIIFKTKFHINKKKIKTIIIKLKFLDYRIEKTTLNVNSNCMIQCQVLKVQIQKILLSIKKIWIISIDNHNNYNLKMFNNR